MTTLFEFAPRELSANAFWAWVLSSLTLKTSHKHNYDRSVFELATAFVRALGQPALADDVREVVVEKSLDDGCRADIVLLSREGGGKEDILCLIENKLFSTPSAERLLKQLDKYKNTFPERIREKVVLARMTWRYDTEQQHAVCSLNGERIKLLGLAQQVQLLQSLTVNAHPIIEQYRRYAKQVLDRRNSAVTEVKLQTPLRRLASLDDSVRSLATHEGQWAFMEQLTKACSRGLFIRNGVNRGGRSWTQARVEDYPLPGGHLFYRLDQNKCGYYLRLNYYTKVPTSHKEEIVNDLKRQFEDSHLVGKSFAGGPCLEWKGNNPKGKESTLWYLYFSEYPDMTVGQLAEWFAIWHRRLMACVKNLS